MFFFQINEESVKLMTDDQLRLFLPNYGDRLALRTFVASNSKRKSNDKLSLLEKLRHKLQRNDTDEIDMSRKQPNIHCRRNALKLEWLIELCLMQFDALEMMYVPVRAKKGGGIRQVKVYKENGKRELLEMSKNIFFKTEPFAFGNENDYECDLMDYKQISLGENITVDDIIEGTKLQKIRFYLSLRMKTDKEDLEKESSTASNSETVAEMLSQSVRSAASSVQYRTLM